MATIEEAKQQLAQQQQAIAQQRQTIEQTRLRPLTAAEVRRQTQYSSAQRKLAERNLELRKQEALRSLTPYEQELKDYQSEISKVEVHNKAVGQEARDWQVAQKLLKEGKVYAARGDTSVMEKIKYLREHGYTSNIEKGLQYKEMAGLKETVFVGDFGYSVAPELQDDFVKNLPSVSVQEPISSSGTYKDFNIPTYSSQQEKKFFESYVVPKTQSIAVKEKPMSTNILGSVQAGATRTTERIVRGVGTITSVPLFFDVKEKRFVSVGEQTARAKEGIRELGRMSEAGWLDIYQKVGIKTETDRPEQTQLFFQKASAPTEVTIPEGKNPTFAGLFPKAIGKAPEVLPYLVVPEIAVATDVVEGSYTFKTYEKKAKEETEKSYKEYLDTDLKEGEVLMGKSEYFSIVEPQYQQAIKQESLLKVGLGSAFLVGSGAARFWKAGTQEYKVTQTLRKEADQIGFVEVKQPYINAETGQVKTVGSYIGKIQRGSITQKEIVTTPFKETFGMQPKSLVYTKTVPSPIYFGNVRAVYGEAPYPAYEVRLGRTGFGKPKISIIGGTQKPLPKELVSQNNLQNYQLKQIIEQTRTGVPVSNPLKFVKEEQNLVAGEVERIDFWRKTGKKTSKSSVVGISELQKSSSEGLIFEIRAGLKDISKPYARATGKVDVIEGKMLILKPKVVGGETSYIKKPIDITKTPLSQTFQVQQQQTQPILATQNIPKISRITKTKTQIISAEETTTYTPSAYAGTGLYERTTEISTPAIRQNGVISSSVLKPTTLETIKGSSLIKPIETSELGLKTSSKADTISKALSKLSPKTTNLIKEALKEEQTQAGVQNFIQKQIPKQKLGQKNTQKMTSSQIGKPKTIFGRGVFSPSSKGGSELFNKLISLKGKGVNVVVGMQKGKEKIIARNLPPFTALMKGRKFVEENIEASFRLVPTGKITRRKDIKPFELSSMFRPSKRNPLFIVEKRRFRLDTAREIRQIKAARLK